MKYLKKFESSEELEFGVTPEDIEYLFTDISDNGWKVDIRFLRKLFDFKNIQYFSHRRQDKPILKFGLIPYIEVSISKPTSVEQRFNRSPWNEAQELKSFTESDEFQEIIEVTSLRLDEFELYIQKQSYVNNTFNILIYRKTDQNYIK
jgi:hypothetical protein